MSNLKKVVQKIFNTIGYEIKVLSKNKYQLIDVFDLLILNDWAKREDFYFIQIGAYDGVTGDPIHQYVKKYHWRGVLVEPQPLYFEKLKSNYSSEPQLVFENAAISNNEGEVTMFAFEDSGELEGGANSMASFNSRHLIHNPYGILAPVRSIKVPSLSFQSLLVKHKISRVDLLQIDTEGYDLSILKLVNFDVIKPRIIRFESGLLSNKDKEEAYTLLSKNHYKLLELGIDTLAYMHS